MPKESNRITINVTNEAEDTGSLKKKKTIKETNQIIFQPSKIL